MSSTNYPNIEHVNENLAKTEELSDHNKEVLDDFFDEWRHRAKERTNSDYANKWLNFSPFINFQIDDPTRTDIAELMKALDRDEITSRYGKPYSPHSKKKHFKALSTFYNNFIEYPNRGYNKDVNGPAAVDGHKSLISEKPEHGVKKETKPSATQVKEIASNLENLRDRALLIFGWSCGARVGEIFKTRHKPQPILWKDISFREDDSMAVRLRKNYKKAKPNRRQVNVIVGKPLMKRLYRDKNPSPEDPVFTTNIPVLKCPRCSKEVDTVHDRSDEGRKPTSSWKRKYTCGNCDDIYQRDQLKSEEKPLTAKRVNGIIKNAVESSEFRNIDKTSHKFFRKSRALHKVAHNWGDSSINGFFGWQPNSRARSNYVEALQVSQKKDLQQEHPKLDINVEGRFYDDSLKPVKCSECGKLNSQLWDLCSECGSGLTFEGMAMKKTEPDSKENELKHKAKTRTINELSDRNGMDESEVQEIMEEKLEEEMAEV